MMKYFKDSNGDVFAYNHSDLHVVATIEALEGILQSEQDQEAKDQAQADLEQIPQVFFDIRSRLETLTEMTEEEVEEHINPPVDPQDEKEKLAAYAANTRWKKETGGTIWNGWPVHTDRESQSKIIAERLAIEAGERNDPDGWKFADGIFRLVSNADFIDLSNAVRNHVRDCYAAEAAILAQIEAGMITEYSQIDAAFL